MLRVPFGQCVALADRDGRDVLLCCRGVERLLRIDGDGRGAFVQYLVRVVKQVSFTCLTVEAILYILGVEVTSRTALLNPNV